MSQLYRVPGPCTATYNSQALAPTKNGFIIRFETLWTPIISDAFGEEPSDFIYGGKRAEVAFVGMDPDVIDDADLFGNDFLQIAINSPPTLIQRSTAGRVLVITEADATTWSAPIAIPQEPSEILLSATQELLLPITFLLCPNEDGKLFTAVPAYLTTP